MGLEEGQRPPEGPWVRANRSGPQHGLVGDPHRRPSRDNCHCQVLDSAALHPPQYRKALAGSCSEGFPAAGSLPALQNFHKEKGRVGSLWSDLITDEPRTLWQAEVCRLCRTPVLLKSPSLDSEPSKRCAQPVACAACSRCSNTVASIVLIFTTITMMPWAPAHTGDRGQNPRV